MTIFAIFKLALIWRPEVDKQSQFYKLAQLWNVVNISRTLRFKF